MKGLYRAALVFGLVAFATTSLEAAVTDTPADEPVRVVNNYGEMVRVYAEDSEGRLHHLGPVARGELVEFEIPGVIAADEFRIKVYPAEPTWSLQRDDFGVKTNLLNLQADSFITVWVEPELANTVVELARG